MKKKEIQLKIGIVIQQRRILLGLTQEALADLTGLHRTYIGSVERGERNITIVNLKKIADALNISLDKLLENEL